MTAAKQLVAAHHQYTVCYGTVSLFIVHLCLITVFSNLLLTGSRINHSLGSSLLTEQRHYHMYENEDDGTQELIKQGQ